MSDRGRTLMVQGTTSDAGKSTLVTALCRWLARRGVAVVPFKPQNMALNSAVTADGGEIGRAQAVQAQACRLAPHTDMNPVLLKPNTDIGAQVIIHGRAVTSMDAAAYHDYKRVAMEAVLASHGRLAAAYRVVMVEGAGSPAEINLRANDIANMGFAEAVDCPVILVADIDRGGVFAHLVGTLELLSDSERERVKGFVINRFRGDIALLQPGLDWLEARTGKPVLGVLPYVSDLHLEAEDAIDTRQAAKVGPRLKVVVPVLPRISNHTDFDPLRLHPQVELSFVGPGQALPSADLIVLPGSKSVRADLAALRERGWDEAILRHLRYGGRLLGICGGLQMLGERLHDPLGLEGAVEQQRWPRPAGVGNDPGGGQAIAQRTGPPEPGGRAAVGLRDPCRGHPWRGPGAAGGGARRWPRGWCPQRRRARHGHLPARPVRIHRGLFGAAALGRPARGPGGGLPGLARTRHRAARRPGRAPPGYRAIARPLRRTPCVT